MENTLENKARFIALYWGQRVLKKDIEGLENFITEPDGFIRSMSDQEYLELKPIESITDEEAEKLGFEDKSHFHADGSIHCMLDDLRLLGFAVDWAGLKVEDLISFGWVKLKTG